VVDAVTETQHVFGCELPVDGCPRFNGQVLGFGKIERVQACIERHIFRQAVLSLCIGFRLVEPTIEIALGEPVGFVVVVKVFRVVAGVDTRIELLLLHQNPGSQGKPVADLQVVVRRQAVDRIGIFHVPYPERCAVVDQQIVGSVLVARVRGGDHGAQVRPVVEQDIVFQSKYPEFGDVVGVFVGIGKQVGRVEFCADKVDGAVGADTEQGKLARPGVAEVDIERQVLVTRRGVGADIQAGGVGEFGKGMPVRTYSILKRLQRNVNAGRKSEQSRRLPRCKSMPGATRWSVDIAVYANTR
jgi:hypothetical protein